MGRFVPFSLWVLLPLACFAVVHVHAERVDKDLYDYCDGNNVDISVYSNDEVYLRTGFSWPVGKSRCRVVLKASDGLSDLYYQFQSYSSSGGYTVEIESKYTFYSDEATYTTASPPLFESEKGNTYLRFTVTKDVTAAGPADIDFTVKIYREDYTSTIGDVIGLTIGAIVGIVIGVIVLIVVTIVLIVCCVVRSTNRGSSGGTVVTSPVAMQGQPYSAQPYTGQQYAGQPYPGQPYAGQPYPGQPQAGQPYGAQTYPVGGTYPMQPYPPPTDQHASSEPSAPAVRTDKL